MYYEIDVIYNIHDLKDVINFTKPYLFKGGCRNMKVFDNKDKLKTLKEKMNDVKLRVEVYNCEKDMGDTKINKYVNLKFNKIYDKITNDKRGKKYYLAELDLFDYKGDLSNNLYKDYDISFDSIRENDSLLLFFGNNGKSGCHLHMCHDYVLNQVFGKKVVYMFDYYDNDCKFKSIFSNRCNFLDENFFEMDHSNMKIYKVELEEGDSLLIPPWWFHAVEGKGLNYSITKTYERSDYLYMLDKPYLLVLLLLSLFYELRDEYYLIILSILLILLVLVVYYIISR